VVELGLQPPITYKLLVQFRDVGVELFHWTTK
jgi:hypothetical protein